MQKIKKINYILLALVILVSLEAFFNLMGRISLIEGNYARAKTFLKIAMDRELLGFVYYKQEQFEEAFNYYQKRKDWRGMGWAYYGLGKFEEARDYFKRVDDTVGLGQVDLALGNLEKAREVFTETNEYSGLALTYLAGNNYNKAMEYFVKAGDSFGLALTFFVKGDYESAVKMFKQIKNDSIKPLELIIAGKFEEADKLLAKSKDGLLYAGFMKSTGRNDEALDIFLENNNYKKSAEACLAGKKLIQAKELFSKARDVNGLGDLFFYLGDYEKSYEYYKQAGNHAMVFKSLILSGNEQQAISLAKKEISANNNMIMKACLADYLRVSGEFRRVEVLLREKTDPEEKNFISDMLEMRLDISRGKQSKFKTLIQNMINYSKSGFMAEKITLAADILGVKFQKPAKEDVPLLASVKPVRFYIIIGIISGIAVIGILFFLFLQARKIQAHRLKSVQVGFKGVSKTHKVLYTESTSLNLSTVSKLREKARESETAKPGEPVTGAFAKPKTPAPTFAPKEETSQPSEEAKPAASPVEKSIIEKKSSSGGDNIGVQLLQLALKELDIVASAFELMELAGEDSSKMTVYGIYLAARSKGAQVQGIKVDIDYLKDESSAIHLVFFHDESFALLREIDGTNVKLTMSPGQDEVFEVKEFTDRWNGYVISLSKS